MLQKQKFYLQYVIIILMSFSIIQNNAVLLKKDSFNKSKKLKLCNKLIASSFICINVLAAPSLAIDNLKGESLFEMKCVGCHSGGSNLLNSGKSLSKNDLLKYNLYDAKSIEEIIAKGAGQMLPYGEFISPKGNLIPAKLDSSEIKAVAEYVIDSASNGWPKKEMNRNCDEYPGC